MVPENKTYGVSAASRIQKWQTSRQKSKRAKSCHIAQIYVNINGSNMTQTNTCWLTDKTRTTGSGVASRCLQKPQAANDEQAISKKLNSWHIADMMH